jgi:hypothetical protein
MIISIFIPLILIIAAASISAIVMRSYKLSQKGRRNPLTRDLLRSPGESLRAQVEDLTSDIIFYFMMTLVIPLVLYSSHLSQKLSGFKPSGLFISFAILLAVLFCMFKLWRLLKKRTGLSLGLDCELAVGQELNQLMLNGYRVYHDFPADKFNIDHVVVGPKGVFAVETKGRAKRDKKGSAEAKVTYDGDTLGFPNGTDKDYLEQAKRQAGWLSKWIGSAAGESVSVQPILALPGWFVDLKKPGGIIVFNGKNPDLLLKWGRDDKLSESIVKRIVYQIDQRCRDVEPTAYSKRTQEN